MNELKKWLQEIDPDMNSPRTPFKERKIHLETVRNYQQVSLSMKQQQSI
jgi:hypothetical protein